MRPFSSQQQALNDKNSAEGDNLSKFQVISAQSPSTDDSEERLSATGVLRVGSGGLALLLGSAGKSVRLVSLAK